MVLPFAALASQLEITRFEASAMVTLPEADEKLGFDSDLIFDHDFSYVLIHPEWKQSNMS